MLFAILATLIPVLPSSSAWTSQKPAVHAAAAHAYPNARVDSILIKQPYALVSGNGIRVALHRSGGDWNVICDLGHSSISADSLSRHCGIPSEIAAYLAKYEPANRLARGGNFSAGALLQQAVTARATAPATEIERARLQQLNMLDEGVRMQMITRDQAIQQWGQLRYSWELPW